MMDIQKIIEEQTIELMSSGKIEEMVRVKLEETVKSVIDDSLRSYSDFGKALKEKISKSLNVDLSKISFPEYQGIMFSFIKEELDAVLVGEAKARMKDMVSEYFKPLGDEEFKISDILEKFQRELKGESHHDNENCTIIYENDRDGYAYLYLDDDEDTDKYSCKYKIRFKDTGIWGLEIEGSDMSRYKGDAIFNFDRFLYQLYTTGKSIILDNPDTEDYTFIGEDY